MKALAVQDSRRNAQRALDENRSERIDEDVLEQQLERRSATARASTKSAL